MNVWLRAPEGEGALYLTERQMHFFAVMEKYKHSSFIGGQGSGKTVTLCASVAKYLLTRPRSEWLLGRYNYRGLVSVTWRTMMRILPPEVILYRCDTPQYLMAVLKNGSILHGWNMSQWEKYSGLNLDGVGIDEATEQREKVGWQQACARLRGKRGPLKSILAGTPNGRDWVWQTFERDADEQKVCVRCRTADNPHLPPEYEIDQRRNYSPEEAARFLDAEWTERTGSVLYTWDPEIHLIDPLPLPMHWPRYRGLDPGFAQDPAACIWAAMDESGNLYVYDEYYERGKIVREQCAAIQKKSWGQRIEWTAIDASAAKRSEIDGVTLMDSYAREGVPCRQGDPRKELWIETLNSYLRPDPEHVHPFTGNLGSPRIFFFRSCRFTKLEAEAWVRDHRGKPVEKNDHLMSALGYLIMSRPGAASSPMTRAREQNWQAFWAGMGSTEADGGLPAIGAAN